MKLPSRLIQIPAKGVKSLAWHDNTLVDWAGGWIYFPVDGSSERLGVHYGYRFDTTLVSPSGRLVLLYEKLGTKAILIEVESKRVLRELSRSYYCADAYEFPIAFLTLPDGSEALVHCPQDYCRIDIDDAFTGRCLTQYPQRVPSDVFHSRFRQSPDGRWFASAGWVWHPVDVACLWNLESVLENPRLLDGSQVELALRSEVDGLERQTGCLSRQIKQIEHRAHSVLSLGSPGGRPSPKCGGAIQGEMAAGNVIGVLVLMDGGVVVVSTTRDSFGGGKQTPTLVTLMAETGAILQRTELPGPAGTLVRISEQRVLSLFGHPRLLEAATGVVIHEWPDLRTGTQQSSILPSGECPPPFAMHPHRPMFAVADEEQIAVVDLDPSALVGSAG